MTEYLFLIPVEFLSYFNNGHYGYCSVFPKVS